MLNRGLFVLGLMERWYMHIFFEFAFVNQNYFLYSDVITVYMYFSQPLISTMFQKCCVGWFKFFPIFGI